MEQHLFALLGMAAIIGGLIIHHLQKGTYAGRPRNHRKR